MQETIEKVKKNIEEILQNEEEHQDKKIEFILINPNTNETLTIASNEIDSMIYFAPYTIEEKNKYIPIADWDFNFDQYFFQDLQKDYQIGYISDKTHYNLWYELQESYPEEIEFKDGVQQYLQYCADNGITKEYIDKKTNLDTPDIMNFFNGLAIHETMTYKGYVLEADDTNYDNPKETIVNIYKSREDFNVSKINERISLNTINLKQNIKEYIDNVYIDKTDFESEKSYITFALGYDLLNDMIKKYDVLECDTNYEFCNNLAKQFLNSNEYSNFSHSSYEMLQEWLSKNMTEIEKSYKEKIGLKDKIYNDNMVILDKGFRKNSPIALVEKTLNENEKEYIIAFNYKINEDKLSWGYAYYYDNDIAKAENDYKKVVSGKSLYNTFDKKDERF